MWTPKKELTKRTILSLMIVCAWVVLSASVCGQTSAGSTNRPNIILIVVDDLGWKDLGIYGSSFYESPNIDKLASQGVKFTDAYASSTVCSPSRSSIMTGQYPVHTGITDWIVGQQNTAGPQPNQKLLPQPFALNLAESEVTVAQALKERGYSTFFAGKWHVGEKPSSWPKAEGFDYNYGGWKAGNPKAYGMNGYFSPYDNPRLTDGPKGEFLPDRLTDETIKFIKKKSREQQPFFANLSFYAVHEPIEAKQENIRRFKKKARRLGVDTLRQFIHDSSSNRPGWLQSFDERIVQANPVYAGLIYSVDENVGRLINTLNHLKIANNTVVVFTSDNGGLSTIKRAPTTNQPLRYGKGWSYEGGIRVPLIVRWPGVAQPGSVSHVPVVNTDFYPTFLQVAGGQQVSKQNIDGKSLVPLLKGNKPIKQPAIFWHYPHYHGGGETPTSAVRKGDWKLIQFYENNDIELYNLRTDIEERRDMSARFPKRTAQLLKMLNDWKKRTEAKLPTINPLYNPFYKNLQKDNTGQ